MPKFTDLLAQSPGDAATKLAAIEGPDQQQLERDFSNIAYAFLKDRAARLLDYLIGFEVVESEPDGSRAVGIFGFRIGDTLYYVPAFFLNNQIKGMDLLYSKKDSSFVPLQESWINHILNRQTFTIGEPAPEMARKDFTVPDFTFMSRPPLGGSTKLSSDLHMRNVWNEMQSTTVAMLEKDPEFQKAFAGAVNSLVKDAQPLERGVRTTLINYLTEAGGPLQAATVLRAFENPTFLKAATTFYDHRDLMIEKFADAVMPKRAQAKIKIVTEREVTDYQKDISDKDRKRIVRDGFSIVDNRTPEERSSVYHVDYLTNVQNPDVSGLYDMTMASGAVSPVYVLHSPYGTSHKGMIVVVNPVDGRHFCTTTRSVFVRDGAEKEKYDPNELFAKGVELSEIKVGNRYILVNRKLQSSLPFDAEVVVSEDGEVARIQVNWKDHVEFVAHEDSLGGSSCTYRGSLCSPMGMGGDYLVTTNRTGELKRSGNKIVVPTESWRAFKLATSRDTHGNSAEAGEKADPESFRPASYVEITEALNKQSYHQLVVETRDGGLAYSIQLDGLVDKADLTTKVATVNLVCRYGFTLDQADEALKEARSDFKARRMIKFAQVMMPEIPPQAMSFDQQLGVPVQPYQVDFATGQTMGLPMTNRTDPGSGVNIGGEGQQQQFNGMALPGEAMRLSGLAAQTGQQQVFDHGVIGGLARIYDVSSTIDSFIPEFMKAIDRVGRVLFLFYWKNEEFAERYGDQDLTEMEDQIRSVFKQFGDLTLKLKQKTIDAENGEYVQA